MSASNKPAPKADKAEVKAHAAKVVSRDVLRDVLLNVIREEVVKESAKIAKVLEHADGKIASFQAGLPLIKGGGYAVKFLVKVGKASEVEFSGERPADIDALLADLSNA